MIDAKRDRSRANARTRKAILDAAAPVLAKNPAASIGEIAETAQMARSTVHRHFPERADLMAALEDRVQAGLADAALRARLQEGTAAEALLRLCQHYFEDADFLMAAYGHYTQADEVKGMAAMDPALIGIVERGHADASIDAALPPAWVEHTLWSLLYTAWLMAAGGRAPKHEALTLFLRSFERILAGPRT